MQNYLRVLGVLVLLVAPDVWAQQLAPPQRRPNIVLLVADDMNWDTPGCFGGAAPHVTPRIDQLAAQGIRFEHAYMNISICTPSRSVLLTGLYPHRNGAEGFERILPGTPNLPARLNKAGYLCGIIGKPLRQQALLRWSATYRWPGVGDEDRWGRDPAIFGQFTRQLLALARTAGQPFFLMASSHDPHRPFGRGKGTRQHEERADASKVFQPQEVTVHRSLPDVPAVREDWANYCTSVRRLDDMVGEVLDALQASGSAQETLVVFLADHGMDFPGAKFNCYPDSVRTPLVIRWPGKVRAGQVDKQHLISSIDLLPTLLDAVGLPTPRCDGRSFLPLLQGKQQAGRDVVFAQFYHIHGADALPMRAAISRNGAYVFNPWSDGRREFQRLHGATFKAMKELARSDATIAARIQHWQVRSVEEFFDRRQDPFCQQNLVADGEGGRLRGQELDRLRKRLREWMVEAQDPALGAFDKRDDPQALHDFVEAYRRQAAARVEELKEYEKAQDFRF